MKKKPATATTLRARPSTRPCRIVQNFHLVWLGGSIDKANNDACRNSITKLRQVVNTVNIFTDVDECIDFITDTKDDRALMVISGELNEIIMPTVQEISQVSAVYIFCENKELHEKWAKGWPKVKDAYTDITSICEALKQATQACDHNLISISFVKTTDGTFNQYLDTLDSSFMYTQILKEILLSIDFEQSHINDFLMYCREQFAGNIVPNLKISKNYVKSIVTTNRFGGIHINLSCIPCSIEHYV
jgi:hypothetical protein